MFATFLSCKPASDNPSKTSLEHAKCVKIHMVLLNSNNEINSYQDSFFVMKSDDGHDYYTFNWGKDLNHYPECELCLSRAKILPTVSSTILKHDTVYIKEKENKSSKLLCVNNGPLIQDNRIHEATEGLTVGTIYTTLVPAYTSRDTNDSVYFIDGVGERLINRFVKIKR